MDRDHRLDALRGLFLVVMTVDHLGSPWKVVTWQPLGWLSAAEGFLFLSGLVYALLHARLGRADGLMAYTRRRALQLYRHQILLLLLPFIVLLLVPAAGEYWTRPLHLDRLSPGDFAVGGSLLVHQPRYVDILPLYIVFLLGAPALLRAYRKGWEARVLLASAGVWLLGWRFDPVAWIGDALLPGAREGLGNLCSWQLLWVVATWTGYRWHEGRAVDWHRRRAVVLVAAAVALFLFLARHDLVGLEVPEAWVERQRLGWLRIVNAGALLVLTAGALRWWPPERPLWGLGLLGRHSLQVYSWHVALLYLSMPLGWRIGHYLGAQAYDAYVLIALAGLAIPAWVHQRMTAAQGSAVPWMQRRISDVSP